MNVTMNTNVRPEPPVPGWRDRLQPICSYIIAIGLTLTGPALIAFALVLTLFAGDPSILAIGLLAGAFLGATGALALLWCLAGFRMSRWRQEA